MLHSELLKRHFNDDYFIRNYKSNSAREEMYKAEYLKIDELVQGTNCKVLDVGCGLGNFLDHFDVEKYEKYGIEISDYAIEIALKKNIIVKTGENSYNYPDEFFDVIVFRGSIQHIPCPFTVIMKCYNLLKKNGIIVFLATPNSNSPYYYRFKNLKFLAPETTYLVPSDLMMSNLLKNFGFEILKINFPYKSTPYAKPFTDRLKYLLSFIGLNYSFAYPKSMMEIFAFKK